jgi:fatty acid desaturase
VRGGRDNDEDALAGSRPDERQQFLSLRSWAMAGKVAMFAAFAGVTIAVAARATWWWPFAAIFAVTGFGYLLGLSNYGVGEEDPADDANAGHQAHYPVNS